MNFSRLLKAALSGLFLLPGFATAGNHVFSGDFDGSEPSTDVLPGTCLSAGSLPYEVVQPLQVSASGDYTVVDAFHFDGVDVIVNVYEGVFSPSDPMSGRLTPGGIDLSGTVQLQPSVDYALVVQHWCTAREGAWAITMSGPGLVTSDRLAAVPEFTGGMFSAQAMANTACGNSQYHATGPVTPSAGGTYYYTDISGYFDVDVCLLVYGAPFDPDNPSANLVAALKDFETVELEAGQDYYFVAQPEGGPDTGDYFFVLAPPAPFRIQFAMAGSWYYPPTSGQGFFMDVFDSVKQMFVGWYTYDLERPDDGVEVVMGDPGHRWFTAQGPFSGNTAELDIYFTTGMIFDSDTPPRNDPVKDGTMTVEFDDCFSGRVSYDIPSVNAVGEVPIQRIVNDAVPLCESLTDGPGQPGPL
ncbi:MAG: hypothetical protein KJN94_00155 [Gammaproteobacteria bacterium]|nr:hypothetical protein [Gammaproteobacteria bacterium]